jgi:hypothetical protein
MDCVYVAAFDARHGVYKVGQTGDPAARRLALRRPYGPARYVHVIETNRPGRLELYLHVLFRDRHIGGELFHLTADDLARVRAVTAVTYKRERDADAVRTWRERAGWSRQRMAKELGVSYDTLRKGKSRR